MSAHVLYQVGNREKLLATEITVALLLANMDSFHVSGETLISRRCVVAKFARVFVLRINVKIVCVTLAAYLG